MRVTTWMAVGVERAPPERRRSGVASSLSSAAPMPRTFLTAEWRNLAMLNYVVEPSLLRSLVPAGTELDDWQGQTYVSLVGFLFANTRLLGVPVPWHRTFEEVNLRFYVRRTVGGETRRGVTFIRELVPRRAIALTARLIYNEPYRVLPMRHQFGPPRPDGVPDRVEYRWQSAAGETILSAAPRGVGRVPEANGQEAFITEHSWGYTRQRNGSTVEYEVSHARWRVWSAEAELIAAGLVELYGQDLANVLNSEPSSAFLADGSPVTVYAPSSLASDSALVRLAIT
jgi:uncharacterized protein